MADKKISALTAASLPLDGTEVLPIVQGGVTVKVSSDNLTTKNFRSNATSGILQVVGPAVGTTRVMTTPNANFTVARTDANQTFTGLQTFSNGGSENIRLFEGTSSSTLQQNDVNLYFNVNDGSASNGIFFWRSSNALTTIMSLSGSTGNLTANTGNFVVGTAGKGIDFSANTNAPGMTSELLDWYEEGVFTPVFNNLTVGDGAVDGRYTRIGRMITATIRLEFGSTSAWTGTCASVAGLPFISVYKANGAMTMYQTNTGWFGGQVMIYAGNSQLSYPTNASGAPFSATSPWVWASGDFAVITISYEA